MAVVTAAGCSHEENKRLMEIIQKTLVLNSQKDSIPYEEDAYRQLQNETPKLSLPSPKGRKATGLYIFDKRYTLERNGEGYESVCFRQREKNVLILEFGIKGHHFSIYAGYEKWITQESDLEAQPNYIHAFSYAWETENVLVVMQYQLNQPSGRNYRFVFQGEDLQFTRCLQPKLSDGTSEMIFGRIC